MNKNEKERKKGWKERYRERLNKNEKERKKRWRARERPMDNFF